MTDVFLSVVIPTRGRSDCVRQTIRDLAAQDYPHFDIWLVDQNETPIQGLSEFDGKVKLYHETMPPLGSHAGRNHAIFKTGAAVCVFVDDDVRVAAGFLAAHATRYAGSKKTLASIAGRVVQPRDGYTEEQMRAMGSPARYNKWLGRVSGNFVGAEAAAVHHVHECNFSAKTEVLRAIGGFNEEFRGNAYFEGADLTLRMMKAGYEVQYRPEIVLTHLQEGWGGNRVEKKDEHTYWYMRNYGLLNSLHMSKVGFLFFSIYSFGYVLAKALKNGKLDIAVQGLRGWLAGMKYFLPGSKRLQIRSHL